jgi:hypothetical protein
MADDAAELPRKLKIERADFFGYSMGGSIALELAMHHPELVGKLVWAGGTSYSPDGLYPVIREGAKDLEPELLAGSPWQRAYAGIAPDPANWSALVFKVKDLDVHFVGWKPTEVQAIQVPARLIIGDPTLCLLGGGVPGDVNGLPRSQLAVLPGTTHVTVVDRTSWLLSMVTAFLDGLRPKATELMLSVALLGVPLLRPPVFLPFAILKVSRVDPHLLGCADHEAKELFETNFFGVCSSAALLSCSVASSSTRVLQNFTGVQDLLRQG